jgi:hypothetical protein
MANPFKKAVRLGSKLTFTTTQGEMLIDQLYQLPLTHATKANLNSVANTIANKIKLLKENVVDFVNGDENVIGNEELELEELKLELVKIIIKDIKKEEQAKAQEAADKAQDRVLDELIAKKKLDSLSDNDIETLIAMKSTNRVK